MGQLSSGGWACARVASCGTQVERGRNVVGNVGGTQAETRAERGRNAGGTQAERGWKRGRNGGGNRMFQVSAGGSYRRFFVVLAKALPSFSIALSYQLVLKDGFVNFL